MERYTVVHAERKTAMKIPQPLRTLVLILSMASLLLGINLSGERLSANTPAIHSATSYNTLLTDEVQTLLPLIPRAPSVISPPLTPGIMGPLPGEPQAPTDQDESKVLYGYEGPYYNTTDLDGRVLVLDQSTYTWPLANWKVTGLFRNQTRAPIHVASLTARLLGINSRVLASATARTPLDDLRPGEPAPFTIEAPVERADIKSIEWHIDSAPTKIPPRMFSFNVYSAQAPTDSQYDLVGSIRNAATSTNSAHIVIAWLDQQNAGKVLYVDSPKLELLTKGLTSFELKSETSIAPLHFVNFFYTNNDPAIVPILRNATFAIWGISN
jgi:hypothetical protein